MTRAWCGWMLRTLWRLWRNPEHAWTAIAQVARARQQHAADVNEWKAKQPRWLADPGLATEVGAQLAMYDCVEWYAAQGLQLCVQPTPTPPAPELPQAAPAPSPSSLSAGEIWAVRDALAEVEGLGTFHKIRGD